MAEAGDSQKQDGDETPMFTSKIQIWRNALVICVGFMLLFTSFQSLGGLQSSLFLDEGLGTASLAIIYASLIISAFFVPSLLISILGCKWTIPVAMSCYIFFMAAHFYATWGLFIPAAVLVGIGAAPLWTAKSTYLTQLAHSYAKMTGVSKDGATNLFFGVFFLFFQSGTIWGSIISSQVLLPKDLNSSVSKLPDAELAKCGKNFCPFEAQKNTTNTNLDALPTTQLYVLAGIYTGFGVLAILVISILLLPMPSEGKNSQGCGRVSWSSKLFVATFLQLRDRRQLLLIPLTMYSGLEQAFFTGDFTQAFVTCPLGKWWVGYVFICYGVVDSICSVTFGKLVEYTGRIPFFILGAGCHITVLFTMLFYNITQTNIYIYFILAATWGMADAIWQTQINALYGVLFKKNSDAAFSNYRMWEAIGFTLAFAYQNYICVPIKIYILLVVLILGMIGYCSLELLERKTKRKAIGTQSEVQLNSIVTHDRI